MPTAKAAKSDKAEVTEVFAKDGQPIHEGQKVWSRARGGRQEGVVEKIFLTEEDIAKAGDLGVSVKHPPKVIYTDQHGHKVSHNPTTLTHSEEE
ncbi:hypothetical protein DENSPDRAFT_832234 [Dentipellis sp. KUC8613]|nr:hypothetical protein DENSPDRAFT_832234 [Dentipellis sp. KUC8613]